jgi:hypothetical protein
MSQNKPIISLTEGFQYSEEAISSFKRLAQRAARRLKQLTKHNPNLAKRVQNLLRQANQRGKHDQTMDRN